VENKNTNMKTIVEECKVIAEESMAQSFNLREWNMENVLEYMSEFDEKMSDLVDEKTQLIMEGMSEDEKTLFIKKAMIEGLMEVMEQDMAQDDEEEEKGMPFNMNPFPNKPNSNPFGL
jgi:hypothetical protein